ncbi:MAG: decaprenyl-phosphate phosphoribosyltransferase [Ignavibacteriales bacterium CG_4_9_14_3_um_filter_30_11]|nr:MAG: decaprenyl-phosphate phosphoribosyltransferase [Ignavibacteriales bacterium CG_4_9_14_3_um_filter_30_11]
MIKSCLKLLRIPQWIKNLFVLVPLIFSKQLFNVSSFKDASFGFLLFCLVSSIVYIINDIIDIESDRQHHEKKHRPLATGKIKTSNAIILAILLIAIAGILSFKVNISFILLLLSYLALNLIYSFSFKHIVILDIFSIAAGFILRVIAGAVIINVEISSWLILTTMFISLFLAIMKRRAELNINLEDEEKVSRKVLTQYTKGFTEQIASIAATAVLVCYALYTVSDRTVSVFGTDNLIFTLPFVTYGIIRYMYLVFIDKKGENTAAIIFTDAHIGINFILYIITTIYIIYI